MSESDYPYAATIRQVAADADTAVWRAAAVVCVLRGTADPALYDAAIDVLTSLDASIGPEQPGAEGIASRIAAPILQVVALLAGDSTPWSEQPDDALVAQGRASAEGARLSLEMIFPRLDGLTAALHEPGAKILDVGTGVAAMAVAYAEFIPTLHVVGIDVLPRALSLAARTVESSTAASRVELRKQSVADLSDTDEYAYAWLPAPFIPEAALCTGATAVARALTPCGWAMVGHGKMHGSATDVALTRFKTIAYGGTALDDARAQKLLAGAGLEQVSTLDTPPGAPALTVGRKPVA